MNKLLKKVFQGKYLTELETRQLFELILLHKINDIQLSAILMVLKIRGETEQEILGAIKACLKYSIPFPKPKYLFSDIVGTGGDNSNSINISTTSALVGSLCGIKIVKHCNSSISSKTGSGDILKELGININIPFQKSKEMLDKYHICFLFSPRYHNNFDQITSVRKALKTRTILNIIAPILNPANPSLIVMGVYDKTLMLPIANVLKYLKYHRAIIIHSNQMDEVTLSGITEVTELKNKKITSYQLSPHDFGFKNYPVQDLVGGTPEYNFKIITKVLKGKGPESISETIAANVAILLKVFGNENLIENASYALNIINSGKVYKKITKLNKL